jgi:hypothetical protein
VSLPAPSMRLGEEPTAWNQPLYSIVTRTGALLLAAALIVLAIGLL